MARQSWASRALANGTTGRSSGWRCPRSGRWWPSRSTCWPTPRSSATSAPTSWPASRRVVGVLLTAYCLFVFLAYGTTGAVAGSSAPASSGRRPRAVQGMWLALLLSIVVAVLAGDHRAAHRRSARRRGRGPATNAHVPAHQPHRHAGAVRHDGRHRLPARPAGHPHAARRRGRDVDLQHRHPALPDLRPRVRHRCLGRRPPSSPRPSARRSTSTGSPARPARSMSPSARTAPRSAASAASGGTCSSAPPRCGVADRHHRRRHPHGPHLAGRPRDRVRDWSFLALSLDAIAIAGQAITGRALGAGDVEGARRAGRRMLQWGLGAGVAGRPVRGGPPTVARPGVQRRSGGRVAGRLPVLVGGCAATGERRRCSCSTACSWGPATSASSPGRWSARSGSSPSPRCW